MTDPKELLVGAIDLHVHCNPDVLPREVGDFEIAKRIVDCGMKGYGIKSHFFCTAQRAELVREVFPKCNAVGALALNRAVGGINPIAVELAGRAGAKIVWFPSCDSKNESGRIDTAGPKSPPWVKIVKETRAAGVAYDPIYILDENGKLIPEVYDVLTVIKNYDMALATSHLTHEEAFALVKEAHARGIRKIIITHCSGPSTYYTNSEQTDLLQYGVYFEHCYTTYSKGFRTKDFIADQIKNVGAEHVIFGTDLGPKGCIPADEGILNFITDMQAFGFSDRDLKLMSGENNEFLISD